MNDGNVPKRIQLRICSISGRPCFLWRLIADKSVVIVIAAMNDNCFICEKKKWKSFRWRSREKERERWELKKQNTYLNI